MTPAFLLLMIPHPVHRSAPPAGRAGTAVSVKRSARKVLYRDVNWMMMVSNTVLTTKSASAAVSVQGRAQQGSGGSLRTTLSNEKSGIDPAYERGL